MSFNQQPRGEYNIYTYGQCARIQRYAVRRKNNNSHADSIEGSSNNAVNQQQREASPDCYQLHPIQLWEEEPPFADIHHELQNAYVNIRMSPMRLRPKVPTGNAAGGNFRRDTPRRTSPRLAQKTAAREPTPQAQSPTMIPFPSTTTIERESVLQTQLNENNAKETSRAAEKTFHRTSTVNAADGDFGRAMRRISTRLTQSSSAEEPTPHARSNTIPNLTMIPPTSTATNEIKSAAPVQPNERTAQKISPIAEEMVHRIFTANSVDGDFGRDKPRRTSPRLGHSAVSPQPTPQARSNIIQAPTIMPSTSTATVKIESVAPEQLNEGSDKEFSRVAEKTSQRISTTNAAGGDFGRDKPRRTSPRLSPSAVSQVPTSQALSPTMIPSTTTATIEKESVVQTQLNERSEKEISPVATGSTTPLSTTTTDISDQLQDVDNMEELYEGTSQQFDQNIEEVEVVPINDDFEIEILNNGDEGNNALITRNGPLPVSVPDKYLLVNYSKNICAESCPEAVRASQFGHLKIKPEINSIPGKKFSKGDLRKFGKNTNGEQWTVQLCTKRDGKYFAVFEGWTANTGNIMSKGDKDTAPEKIKQAEVREAFCIAFVQRQELEWQRIGRTGRTERILKRNRRAMEKARKNFKITVIDANVINNSTHEFWKLADLSYFHSIPLLKAGQAEIFYMSAANGQTYPDYYMLVNSIMSEEVAEKLKGEKWSKHISELIDENEDLQEQVPASGCQSCKCNIRHRALYDGIQQIVVDKDGFIDVDSIDHSGPNIIVECSNVCGCNSSCKNRQLQKGQQKVLAVVHQSRKGYGLFAATEIKRGEFISEYVGKLTYEDKTPETPVTPETSETPRDTSYEMSLESFPGYILDAKEFGNVTRFPNHSCDPICRFIDVHSREKENEVTVPRVGLYALRNIAVGEELTARYFVRDEVKRDPEERGPPCLCYSDNCIEYLPA